MNRKHFEHSTKPMCPMRCHSNVADRRQGTSFDPNSLSWVFSTTICAPTTAVLNFAPRRAALNQNLQSYENAQAWVDVQPVKTKEYTFKNVIHFLKHTLENISQELQNCPSKRMNCRKCFFWVKPVGTKSRNLPNKWVGRVERCQVGRSGR